MIKLQRMEQKEEGNIANVDLRERISGCKS